MAASSKDATFVRAPLQKTYSLFTAAKLGKSFDFVLRHSLILARYNYAKGGRAWWSQSIISLKTVHDIVWNVQKVVLLRSFNVLTSFEVNMHYVRSTCLLRPMWNDLDFGSRSCHSLMVFYRLKPFINRVSCSLFQKVSPFSKLHMAAETIIGIKAYMKYGSNHVVYDRF